MNLNWGIIGCGNIADKFAQDLALVENNTLYAVASRTESKAKQFAQDHQAIKYYGDYQSLCTDPNIDIVYLATPHNSHKVYGEKVMNYGKHLLCEKALAVNRAEVESMILVAKTNQVFFMEALWSRFNPSIVSALSKVKSQEIGEVTYLNADFCFYKEFDPNHRLFNPMLAGGALLDVGVYPLFLSYLLLGMPNEIKATSVLHDNGVDLQTAVCLSYLNATAILNFGFLNDAEMIGRINGTEGIIYLDKRWHETQGYTLLKDGQSEHYSLPTLGLGYSHEIIECHKCITQGKLQSDLWSHQDSLHLISMCDEIRRQIGMVYPFEKL